MLIKIKSLFLYQGDRTKIPLKSLSLQNEYL